MPGGKCQSAQNTIIIFLLDSNFFCLRKISAFLGQSPTNTIIVRENYFIFFSSLFFVGFFLAKSELLNYCTTVMVLAPKL